MQIPSSIIIIPGLLKAEELQEIDTLLPSISFESGSSTAQGAAKEVKNNLQASREENAPYARAQEIVFKAIASSPLVQAGVMPKNILPPIISKYSNDMHYGWHTDSPLMSNEITIRVDMSMTLFLSDPATYKGGELVIYTPTGYTPYKLERGSAIIYPTTRLHCVNPVTEGERIACVTWLQSMVRDTEKREILFQLKYVQEFIGNNNSQSLENLMLLQLYSNLTRMWAEL